MTSEQRTVRSGKGGYMTIPSIVLIFVVVSCHAENPQVFGPSDLFILMSFISLRLSTRP